MRLFKMAILATTMLSTSAGLAKADVKVVASIKPIHSLVSAVMQDVGEPVLLVEGAGSPHTYSLKPSQARQLQEADAVFWMGHDLEAFLENSIENIAVKAVSIPLMESHGLIKLPFREGGAFDAHDHDHDDHDDHDDDRKHHDHDDDRKHDDHDDDHKHHDHDDDRKHDDHDDDHKHHEHDDDRKHDDHDDDHKHHDHDDHDDHGHGETDPHVWLDPQNAKALVHEIEERLAEIDPANAAIYEANATAMMKKLDSLNAEIEAELRPVRGRGFIVFHDAYQYFEKRFGLTSVGSLTISPEVMPGADRVRKLRKKVRELDASCVFSEPQFEPKLVRAVTENTGAGTGVLDPLGAALDDGPQLYFTLIRTMASSVKACLTKAGS